MNFFRHNKLDALKYAVAMASFPIGDVVLPSLYGKLTYDIVEEPHLVTKDIRNIAGVLILHEAMTLYINKLDADVIPKLKSFVRVKIVREYLDKLANNYQDPPSGKIMHELVNLPPLVVGVFDTMRVVVIPCILVCLFGAVYFAYLSLPIFIIFISFIVIIIAILRIFFRSFGRKASVIESMEMKMHEEITDMFGNILNIYASSKEDEEIDRIHEIQNVYDSYHQRVFSNSASVISIISFITTVMFITILVLIIALYRKGMIRLDGVVGVIGVLNYVIGKINTLARATKNLVFDIGAINAINDKIVEMLGEYEVRDKTSYPDQNDEALFRSRGLGSVMPLINYPDFTINKGDIVQLRAPNGSGKSTLVYILLGLRPYTGNLTHCGRELSSINTSKIREEIGYMPQGIVLFNRSIWSNIFYGTEDSLQSRQEVLKFLEIHSLELGDLDRLAGKNGDRLSGGQKQIVYLLRILLQNKNVVILDEPTAAVDAGRRVLLGRVIKHLSQDKTVVIISHDDTFEDIVTKNITF